MVDFSDLPEKILKEFIILEDRHSDGNRLFIIKRKVPFNKRGMLKKKYTSKNIPHKYQQNNTLEEANLSIRNYLIEVEGIVPSDTYGKSISIFSRLSLLFFGPRL